MPKLKAAGTVFMTSSRLVEINADGIVTQNTHTNQKTAVSVDFTVLSLGSRSDNSLFEKIKDSKAYKVINVGDSNRVGRIANATEAAYQAVVSID